ncbi:hypothetical protein pb186bvf_011077 [Paramecium bursaria]
MNPIKDPIKNEIINYAIQYGQLHSLVNVGPHILEIQYKNVIDRNNLDVKALQKNYAQNTF